MHYDGSITAAEETLRQPLFAALYSASEPAITEILSNPILSSVLAMPDDGENPTTGTARRLLRFGLGEPLLHSHATPSLAAKWGVLTRGLAQLVKMGDEEVLAQYHRSQPWSAFREEYAKGKVSRDKVSFRTRADMLKTDDGEAG